MPIYLDALGTMSAPNTVSIHSQIDGNCSRSISPKARRSSKATRSRSSIRARCRRPRPGGGQESAGPGAARLGAEGPRALSELAAKDFATQQSVDQQQAKVDQFKATIDADQAAIDNAQTQLSYATITAPFDGRVGFRQVDAGNIVHPTDPNPLTVLTQIKPAMVIFTLPQKNLGDVREAMLRGAVDGARLRSGRREPARDGELLLIDNQIDQTTSTIRLKARFPNDDSRLWPGEFVRIRAQIDARQHVVTIPAAALQRGPNGLYTWVIKPDNTAEQRNLDAQTVDGDTVIVNKGSTPARTWS